LHPRKTSRGGSQFAASSSRLQLAQQNLIRQRQIAAADIEQTRTELEVAQEQYDRDRDLVSAVARLESQAHLAGSKAQLAKATSRREVRQRN